MARPRISAAARRLLVTANRKFTKWLDDNSGTYPALDDFVETLSPSRRIHPGKWNVALEQTGDATLIGEFNDAMEAWAVAGRP